MVSVEKIQRGIARYIDAELLPKAEGKDKWILTGISSLYLAKLPNIIQQVKNNPAVKLTGVISDDGMIDLESLINSVRPAARQSPAIINIPFGGEIRFTEQDLNTIYNYISQA